MSSSSITRNVTIADSDEDTFVVVERPMQKVTECARQLQPLLDLIQKNVSEHGRSPLFHTNQITEDQDPSMQRTETVKNKLFNCFVQGLPAESQREFNCSACRQFMRRYGDLCVVEDNGELRSIFWSLDLEQLPSVYRQPVSNALKEVQNGTVGDEYVMSSLDEQSRILGLPVTNGRKHLSAILQPSLMAVKPEWNNQQDTMTSYTMLQRILDDNSISAINHVHHLIHDNQLPHATSHKAPTQYLKDVATKLADVTDDTRRRNLITKLSREAFVGCLSSLRGGMLGYLFECVREGQTFDQVKRNWQTKADPVHYLRPVAAPSQGNIESAEKIFAKLGFTPRDLERVYLTHDQVPKSATLWSSEPRTRKEENATQKLFASVTPKGQIKDATEQEEALSKVPLTPMTFRTFVHKVVPHAKAMHVLIPDNYIQPYFFTTGKPDTKPIMEFHTENSHTASWFTWAGGGQAKDANLKNGKWTPVRSIVSFPHMWDHLDSAADALDSEKKEAFRFKRHGVRFLFSLEGAREMMASRELCLFPTLMKGEFHAVRSTVEAFSMRGRIEYPIKLEEIVAGMAVKEDDPTPLTVGVRTKDGQVSRYKIELLE